MFPSSQEQGPTPLVPQCQGALSSARDHILLVQGLGGEECVCGGLNTFPGCSTDSRKLPPLLQGPGPLGRPAGAPAWNCCHEHPRTLACVRLWLGPLLGRVLSWEWAIGGNQAQPCPLGSLPGRGVVVSQGQGPGPVPLKTGQGAAWVCGLGAGCSIL